MPTNPTLEERVYLQCVCVYQGLGQAAIVFQEGGLYAHNEFHDFLQLYIFSSIIDR